MQYVVCKMMPSINTCNVEGVFNDVNQAQSFAQLFSISDHEHEYAVYELVLGFSEGTELVPVRPA